MSEKPNITYEKTVWENNKTNLNASNMNKIESGIEQVADAIQDIPEWVYETPELPDSVTVAEAEQLVENEMALHKSPTNNRNAHSINNITEFTDNNEDLISTADEGKILGVEEINNKVKIVPRSLTSINNSEFINDSKYVNDSTFTKENGRIWREVYDSKDGVITGCELSIYDAVDIRTLKINTGTFIVCGRQIRVDNEIQIPFELSDWGMYYSVGVIYKIDLTNNPNPTTFEDGEIRLVGKEIPEDEITLVQEDINKDGNVYEILIMELPMPMTEIHPSQFPRWEKVIIHNKIVNRIADLESYIGYTDSDILGVEVDFKNNRFTRLAGAVGLTAGADFDQFGMYQRRRCNLTNEGIVTAYRGEYGYTESGFTNVPMFINSLFILNEWTEVQVMVEQKPFYFRRVPLELELVKNRQWCVTKARYYISEKPKVGFELHPAFLNDGENIYLAAYEGSRYITALSQYLNKDIAINPDFSESENYAVDLNTDKLSSVANALVLLAGSEGMMEEYDVSPRYDRLAGNRNGSQDMGMLTLFHDLNPNWNYADLRHISATQALFLIEYASFDSQAHVGTGKSGVGVADTGITQSLGDTSGVMVGGLNDSAVSYRGEENLWGNTNQWIELRVGEDGGVNLDFNNLQMTLNMTDRMGNTVYLPVSKYEEDNEGWGYISRFYNDDCYFLPAKLEGNSRFPVGDMFNLNAEHNSLVFGGVSNGRIRRNEMGLFNYTGVTVDYYEQYLLNKVSARLVYSGTYLIRPEPSTYDISANSDGSIVATFYPTEGLLVIEGQGEMAQNITSIVSGAGKITKIIIQEGVTNISDYAFESCTDLETVIIPNSVTSIGTNAFQLCIKLTDIALPNSLISIGAGAFNGCENLTEMSIPLSVEYIYEEPFAYSNISLILKPEALEKPEGWDISWNRYDLGQYLEVWWGGTQP